MKRLARLATRHAAITCAIALILGLLCGVAFAQDGILVEGDTGFVSETASDPAVLVETEVVSTADVLKDLRAKQVEANARRRAKAEAQNDPLIALTYKVLDGKINTTRTAISSLDSAADRAELDRELLNLLDLAVMRVKTKRAMAAKE